MFVISRILRLAGPLRPGFHIKIENAPWQDLVIEDIQQLGPRGFPSVSVAHYGIQNGDLMRDPEMLFEVDEFGNEIILRPFAWRNDYVGVEEYSVSSGEHGVTVNSRLLREHESFARMWDKNLLVQGFLEAFQRSRR